VNRLPLVLALLVIASPIAAQTKVLVAKERVPIIIDDEFTGGIAYPTACDEQGRSYIKLLKPGPGMVGPLFKLSSQGVVETQFDTSGALINRYAVRPDGGVIMMHSDGGAKFLDDFAPDGKRETSVRLESPPTPFFPSQLAVFHSGEIFISGLRYRPGYKAGAGIYSRTGSLVKQLTFEKDEKVEQEIANDLDAQKLNREAVDKSVAIAADDGLVYLMRATSPAIVYAISPAGDVLRTIVVVTPSGAGMPEFGLRVVKNRLLLQFRRKCDGKVNSCQGSIYAVLDATTGKTLAAYEADKEVAGPIACYIPDPDRLFIFSASSDRHGLDIVEAQPRESSP
jgi:hypothetical protein